MHSDQAPIKVDSQFFLRKLNENQSPYEIVQGGDGRATVITTIDHCHRPLMQQVISVAMLQLMQLIQKGTTHASQD